MIGKRTSMILVAMLAASAAAAQVRTVDPNQAGTMAAQAPVESHSVSTPVPPDADAPPAAPASAPIEQPAGTHPIPAASHAEIQARDSIQGGTYEQGDVVGAAEGDVYIIGGLTASYLRRGDTVLIPIRMGVGWRLGANLGYMRFSEKGRWLPF
jgi:hypothetical protein